MTVIIQYPDQKRNTVDMPTTPRIGEQFLSDGKERFLCVNVVWGVLEVVEDEYVWAPLIVLEDKEEWNHVDEQLPSQGQGDSDLS